MYGVVRYAKKTITCDPDNKRQNELLLYVCVFFTLLVYVGSYKYRDASFNYRVVNNVSIFVAQFCDRINNLYQPGTACSSRDKIIGTDVVLDVDG